MWRARTASAVVFFFATAVAASAETKSNSCSDVPRLNADTQALKAKLERVPVNSLDRCPIYSDLIGALETQLLTFNLNERCGISVGLVSNLEKSIERLKVSAGTFCGLR